MMFENKSHKPLVRSAWVIAVWLGCFAAAAAQLPPDVMVDKYLLQAGMLSEEKDHKGALEAMDRILALQKEHDLTFPEAFPFHYAQTALAAGSVQAAIDAANRYLSAVGRAGKFYREALELLVKAERKLLEPAGSREGTGQTEAGERTATPGSVAGIAAGPKDNCGATGGGLREMEQLRVFSQGSGGECDRLLEDRSGPERAGS